MTKIFIIADDLTGAAEIAGIAFGHGFSVCITSNREINRGIGTDVIVVNSDTRNSAPLEASKIIRDISLQFEMSEDVLVFKKTDSILRGQIVTEIKALLAISPYRSALLIPVNPSKGQSIIDGRYFIRGKPINQTHHRNDPEFPREDEDIRKLISDCTDDVETGHIDTPPRPGQILVPDISSIPEIRNCLARVQNERILMAGGADFFRECLFFMFPRENKDLERNENLPSLRDKYFIIGSSSGNNRYDIEILEKEGFNIFEMPFGLSKNDENYEGWKARVLEFSRNSTKAVITAPREMSSDSTAQAFIAESLGEIGAEIIASKNHRTHILITGGRTASCFCAKMKWDRLSIQHVHGEGSIGVKNESSEHLLTIKPGSYPWPSKLLQ